MTEDAPMDSGPAVSDYGWKSSGHPPFSELYQSCDPQESAKLRPLKALDLGSGKGALCNLIYPSGFDVVVAEADLTGVEIARRQMPGVSFHCLRVEDDPTELIQSHGLFDAVVSTEVLEHLYLPNLVLRFAWSCLRPGGLLVLFTPYHGYLKNLVLSLMGKWDHYHAVLLHGGHIKFWSRATLTQLLVDEGFELEVFRGVGRLPCLGESMILTARKPMASE